jgi:antitoxin ChpS
MLQTQTNFRRFGSSLGLTIPRALRDDMGFYEGQSVLLQGKANRLIVIPQMQPKKKFTLNELVAQCDLSAPMPQDLMDWQNMPPVGQEML